MTKAEQFLITDQKLKESFNILEEVLSDKERVVVAYSGGKDSTALALLLFQWIVEKKKKIDVVLLHSDTLSEVPEMEDWIRTFAKRYVEMLSKNGSSGILKIVRPEPWETFYWRVLVRGYPAPTFKWRWCVDLLKRRPSKRFFKKIEKGTVMLLGHRDSESLTRAHTLSVRLGKCPLLSDSCSKFYQTIEGDIIKAYPLRNWNEEDVWNYTDSWRKEMGDLLKQLYRLYSLPARYGCWHCTLVKTQLAHIALGKGHLYFEAVRKIYKALSDMPEFRAKKNYGYSKLGFLQAPARSLLLHTMLLAEKLSGIRLYGIDVSKIKGFSLRELFWEIPEIEADNIIMDVEREKLGNLQRFISIRDLRNLEKYRKDLVVVKEHPLIKNDSYAEEILAHIL